MGVSSLALTLSLDDYHKVSPSSSITYSPFDYRPHGAPHAPIASCASTPTLATSKAPWTMAILCIKSTTMTTHPRAHLPQHWHKRLPPCCLHSNHNMQCGDVSWLTTVHFFSSLTIYATPSATTGDVRVY